MKAKKWIVFVSIAVLLAPLIMAVNPATATIPDKSVSEGVMPRAFASVEGDAETFVAYLGPKELVLSDMDSYDFSTKTRGSLLVSPLLS